MIKRFFQSLGIVVSLVIAVVLTLILLYISYILAIGLALVCLIYIVYQSLKLGESPK